MAKQYWVGEFFVDLSRNQISQLGESQTLPPKALRVLTLLAQNRGRVVSQDELLEAVWPNTVVTPNTLQRSIAQLRKALGENSKAQGIIKTHAKQGYSLECDVNWSEPGAPGQDTGTVLAPAATEDSQDIVNKDTPEQHADDVDGEVKPVNPVKPLWLVVIAMVAVLLVFITSRDGEGPKFERTDLRYLTATDNKEFDARYSPDGSHILFRRYLDLGCINNIWVKNADTYEEARLTAETGTYGNYSLSPDGKTLVFVRQDDCTQPVEQNLCYTLMQLDFADALTEPQTPTELLNCQHSEITKPIWIDNQNIAMLQKDQRQWRLIRYSMDDKSSTPLYEIEGGNLIFYDFSARQGKFVVISHKQDGTKYIDMLSVDGQLLSSNPIRLPAGAPRHLSFYPAFIPGSEHLLFSDGGIFYTLSYEGEIHPAGFQLDQGAGAPHFHPDGKRLLLITGKYDSDLARLTIPRSGLETPSSVPLLPEIFERSVRHEDNAKMQPGGNRIAFVSKRTGREQIWLTGDQQARVISDFPRGAFLADLHWSHDGNSLLLLADNTLHQVSLDGQTRAFDFRYPVSRLFDWDSNQRQIIANINVNGSDRFVTLNLDDMTYQSINSKQVNWAVKSEDGTLVFTDEQDRFWRLQAVEDKLIDALTGQGSAKRFVISHEQVVGINKANQLWSFNLTTESFQVLGEVPDNVDYLTDISDNELLLSVVEAAKKEVIELTFANQ